MLDHAVESGAAPNTEQTRGMITSLWTVNECLGNYLGSTLGGVTFDVMGFENATLIVVGIGAFLLVRNFTHKVQVAGELSCVHVSFVEA